MGIKSVDDLIYLDVVSFIDYVQELDFSECNQLGKLLEVEQARVQTLQVVDWQEFNKGSKLFFALANPNLARKAVEDLATQYVMMQRIEDRILVINKFKKLKGVDLSIFSSQVK